MTEETNGIKEKRLFNSPKNKTLFNLAVWAGAVSWLVLVFEIIKSFFSLFSFFIESENNFPVTSHFFTQIFFLLGMISPVFSAVFVFFILQTLKELLFLFLDIRETALPEESEE